MPVPPLDVLPSEATVAEATNRLVLSRLDDPMAWVLVPSNIQEKDLGFDAGFRNAKLSVVQYKQGRKNKGGTVSASVNVEQHRSLRRTYQKPGLVFYAFGDFASYRDLDEAHRLGTVLQRMVFVDATAFPVGTTTLSLHPPDELFAFKDHERSRVEFIDGDRWASQWGSCEYGANIGELDDLMDVINEGRAGSLGAVRFLISRAP